MSTAEYVRLLRSLKTRSNLSGPHKLGERAHRRTKSIDEARARQIEVNPPNFDLSYKSLCRVTNPDTEVLGAEMRARMLGLPALSVEIATGRGLAGL